MEKYYKITPEEAAVIGYFKYSDCEAIDPFSGEQKDGSFIIFEDIYNLLKDTEKFKKVDFSNKILISLEDLIFLKTE